VDAKQEVSILEQLDYLRGMTIRTGSIHEAQALQLRNWGKLIPGTKEAVCKIDVERKIVTYTLSPKGKAIAKSQVTLKWCSAINQWTKRILWPETTVVMESGKKVLYDSRTQKSQKQTDS